MKLILNTIKQETLMPKKNTHLYMYRVSHLCDFVTYKATGL